VAVFCPSFSYFSRDLNDRFGCSQTFRILLLKIEQWVHRAMILCAIRSGIKGVSFQERIVDWTENESILIVPGYQNRPSNTIQ